MLKATYLQQCAHNLSERIKVQDALKERCSVPRTKYLKAQLNYLLNEKRFFEKIKSEFIIFKSDCWRL